MAPVDRTPLTDDEIRALWRAPHRSAEVLLGRWARVADRIWTDPSPTLLLLTLLLTSALAALAYGLVVDPQRAWSVAALYGGSVLLCHPALHVFGCYLDGERRPTQDLALALTLSATAALFTFGFAPVLWFLDLTMKAGPRGVSVGDISAVMLSVAFFAGLGQLGRAVGRGPGSAKERALVLAWGVLVAGITWRMAAVVGLVEP